MSYKSLSKTELLSLLSKVELENKELAFEKNTLLEKIEKEKEYSAKLGTAVVDLDNLLSMLVLSCLRLADNGGYTEEERLRNGMLYTADDLRKMIIKKSS